MEHMMSKETLFADKLADLTEANETLQQRLVLLTQHCRDILLLSIMDRQEDKRKELSRYTKMIIRDVIANEPFNGRCPCCLARNVLSQGKTATDAQFDHFYGAKLNRPELAWILCTVCHRDFSVSPLMRIEALPKFHHFQSHVLDRVSRRPPTMFA